MTDPCPLSLHFDDCQAGWITLHLRLDDRHIELHLSHWLDPLGSIYAWLEAMVLGLPRCGWTLDEEGRETEFDAETAAWQPSGRERQTRLTVRPDDDTPALELMLETRSLVRMFYGAVREFATSDRYRPGEWQHHTLGERIAEVTGQSPLVWVETLLARTPSRRQVQQQIWLIDRPMLYGHPPCTDITGTAAEYARLTGGAPRPDGAYPHYKALDDWKEVSFHVERRAYLTKLLDLPADHPGWLGHPLPHMRSQLIEDWLASPDGLRPMPDHLLPPEWPKSTWQP